MAVLSVAWHSQLHVLRLVLFGALALLSVAEREDGNQSIRDGARDAHGMYNETPDESPTKSSDETVKKYVAEQILDKIQNLQKVSDEKKAELYSQSKQRMDLSSANLAYAQAEERASKINTRIMALRKDLVNLKAAKLAHDAAAEKFRMESNISILQAQLVRRNGSKVAEGLRAAATNMSEEAAQVKASILEKEEPLRNDTEEVRRRQEAIDREQRAIDERRAKAEAMAAKANETDRLAKELMDKVQLMLDDSSRQFKQVEDLRKEYAQRSEELKNERAAQKELKEQNRLAHRELTQKVDHVTELADLALREKEDAARLEAIRQAEVAELIAEADKKSRFASIQKGDQTVLLGDINGAQAELDTLKAKLNETQLAVSADLQRLKQLEAEAAKMEDEQTNGSKAEESKAKLSTMEAEDYQAIVTGDADVGDIIQQEAALQQKVAGDDAKSGAPGWGHRRGLPAALILGIALRSAGPALR